MEDMPFNHDNYLKLLKFYRDNNTPEANTPEVAELSEEEAELGELLAEIGNNEYEAVEEGADA